MADALITTAAGLFVAVPAVVAYNQFAARVRIFAAAIDDFSRELLNSMEELQMRPPAPVANPMSPRPLSETGRELPTRG
jgi:biopolymer transport protein TolQ